MIRRSRQSKVDNLVFPVRVRLAAPPDGFGGELGDILLWLKKEIGLGAFAQHTGDTLSGDTLSVYFRRLEDAARFLEAFPLLELADGTTWQT